MVTRKLVYMGATLLVLLSACAHPVVVPLNQRHDSPYYFAEVEFNGIRTEFILDTGTSFPLVSESFLATNAIDANGGAIESRLVISSSDLKNIGNAVDASRLRNAPHPALIESATPRIIRSSAGMP